MALLLRVLQQPGPVTYAKCRSGPNDRHNRLDGYAREKKDFRIKRKSDVLERPAGVAAIHHVRVTGTPIRDD
jgi:hypothetical protein